MEWVFFVIIALLFNGVSAVVNRFILRDEHVLSFSFLFSFLSSLFFIPLLFIEPITLPATLESWGLVIAAGILWWVINVVAFTGVSKIDITLVKPISASKIIFVLILSVLFLGEQIDASRIAGTILVVLGMLVLTWSKGWFHHLKSEGVQLTLIAAVLVAIVASLDKFNIGFVSTNVYGFLMYFLPSMLMLPMLHGKSSKLKRTFKNKWKVILLVPILQGVVYYSLLSAYRLADISVIYPVFQLATLVTLVVSYFWLKEKKQFKQRLAGALLMIIGAVLVTLGA